MKKVLALFDPRKQSQLQKIGLFAAVLAAIVIIAIHNPIQGYQTEVWTPWPEGINPLLLGPDIAPLSFLQWRSIGASTEILKPIGSLLMWLSSTFVALIAWLVIFRPAQEIKLNTPSPNDAHDKWSQ